MLVVLEDMIEGHERCLMQHSTLDKTPPVHQYRVIALSINSSKIQTYLHGGATQRLWDRSKCGDCRTGLVVGMKKKMTSLVVWW